MRIVANCRGDEELSKTSDAATPTQAFVTSGEAVGKLESLNRKCYAQK